MSRMLVFADHAWDDYLYWQLHDKRALKKVNSLIEDVRRNGNEGLGNPEPLTDNLSGYWSRRVNEKDRLVYKAEDDRVVILQCRTHYGQK